LLEQLLVETAPAAQVSEPVASVSKAKTKAKTKA